MRRNVLQVGLGTGLRGFACGVLPLKPDCSERS